MGLAQSHFFTPTVMGAETCLPIVGSRTQKWRLQACGPQGAETVDRSFLSCHHPPNTFCAELWLSATQKNLGSSILIPVPATSPGHGCRGHVLPSKAKRTLTRSLDNVWWIFKNKSWFSSSAGVSPTLWSCRECCLAASWILPVMGRSLPNQVSILVWVF